MATIKPRLTQTAELWDKHAPTYQAMVKNGIMNTLTDAVISEANLRFPFSSNKTTAILDDGCGPGNVTEKLIAVHGDKLPSNVRLLATDFSSAMIDQVNSKKESHSDPAWKKVEASVLDAQNLATIKDGELSHVISNMCLFIAPDPEKALAEVHRVLAPGGVAVFTSPRTVPWYDSIAPAQQVRPNAPLSISIPESWRSEESMQKKCLAAGFVDVKTATVPAPMQLPSDLRAFWSNFVRSDNPGNVELFHDWSEADLDKAVDLIVESQRKEYGDKPIHLEGEMIMTSVVKK